jgi:acyl carrier protein
MTQPAIAEQVESFIRQNFLYTRPDFDLAPDRSLLESGIIDSMGVLELVEFLQAEFGVTVSDAEITEENLGTLAGIGRLVEGKVRAEPPRVHAA